MTVPPADACFRQPIVPSCEICTINSGELHIFVRQIQPGKKDKGIAFLFPCTVSEYNGIDQEIPESLSEKDATDALDSTSDKPTRTE
jgi:hypothetical protein